MSGHVTLSDRLLRSVEKPSRYVGGEWNSVVKETDIALRVALCFPDLYEIGMSNLAVSILYQEMNARDNTWCERVFAPAPDMRSRMVEEGIPLFSLESRTPLADFDVIGFTLQYEMSYITMLDMLRLGSIPLRAADRSEEDPLVIAGGPCTVNSEPVADFLDLVVLGDGEIILPMLLDLWLCSESKSAFLEAACRLEGVYVPAFYTARRDTSGLTTGFEARLGAPLPVKRTIVPDLDDAFLPQKPIVPNQEIVHDRMVLELFRGCTRGCRFCQAGQVYRPVRERSPELLARQAEALLAATGYDELGLLSLSTSDYGALPALTDVLVQTLSPCGVSLSLPSLRLDSFNFDLMEKVKSTRKAGLTFAVEAGSERLRNRINKNISEADVLEAADIAFAGGWRTLKFYFMLGLPGETDEDVDGIADLVFKVVDRFYRLPPAARKKSPTITVSTSFFIPKPWTPFQWEPLFAAELYQARQKRLADRLRHRFIRYNWHDAGTAVIEAVLARGDRRLSPVLETVLDEGGTLESWREHFSYMRWEDALNRHGLAVSDYTREHDPAEVLAWDLLDPGVTKRHLLKERDAANAEQLSADCMTACAYCGAQCYQTGVCLTHDR